MREFEAMSSTVRRLHYTIAQYVSLEEESSIRHEYLDGEIYALAGGSLDHAALAAVVIREMTLSPLSTRSSSLKSRAT